MMPYVQTALRHPSGIKGRLVAKAFDFANAVSARDLVSRYPYMLWLVGSLQCNRHLCRLGLQRSDNVLEVGFGTGTGLQAAAKLVETQVRLLVHTCVNIL